MVMQMAMGAMQVCVSVQTFIFELSHLWYLLRVICLIPLTISLPRSPASTSSLPFLPAPHYILRAYHYGCFLSDAHMFKGNFRRTQYQFCHLCHPSPCLPSHSPKVIIQTKGHPLLTSATWFGCGSLSGMQYRGLLGVVCALVALRAKMIQFCYACISQALIFL